MAHLSVDQLEPGMVLASDVMTGRGQRLIASGQELSDRHLQGLKTWGIAHVEIQGDAPEATQVSALFTEAAEGEMQAHFSNVDTNHRLIRALFQQCRQRRAEALSHEGVREAPSHEGVRS